MLKAPLTGGLFALSLLTQEAGAVVSTDRGLADTTEPTPDANLPVRGTAFRMPADRRAEASPSCRDGVGQSWCVDLAGSEAGSAAAYVRATGTDPGWYALLRSEEEKRVVDPSASAGTPLQAWKKIVEVTIAPVLTGLDMPSVNPTSMLLSRSLAHGRSSQAGGDHLAAALLPPSLSLLAAGIVAFGARRR